MQQRIFLQKIKIILKLFLLKNQVLSWKRNFNENKNDKNGTTNDKNENEFKNFVKKCENWKKEVKKFLINIFIKLGESFNNNLFGKNKVELG